MVLFLFGGMCFWGSQGSYQQGMGPLSFSILRSREIYKSTIALAEGPILGSLLKQGSRLFYSGGNDALITNTCTLNPDSGP